MEVGLLSDDSGPTAGRGGAESRASILSWRRFKSNFKSDGVWQEVSGSLGDMGTFLPLLLTLSLVNGLNFGTTLIFTGLYNIITGGLFGVPMPVQPMKSIAAVAIAEGNPLTVPQIMAAGITTAALLLFLGVTGLMTVVQKVVPLSVVRGIQLSQGIAFGLTAVKYVLKNQDFMKSTSTTDRGWLGWDGLVLALSAFLFVTVVTGAGGARKINEVGGEAGGEGRERQSGDEETGQEKDKKEVRAKIMSVIPSALIVFMVGVVIAIIRDPSAVLGMKFGPSPLAIVSISWSDWKIGFIRAAIPQIPLSILNSVIAVCKLSNDLFPEKKVVTPSAVSTSVGLMNLVGCWFGAMPVCHGAGGLAGQYRFGARTGLSVVILGTAKLVIGLVFGSSLLRLLGQFPVGLLGVLLFFSGLELAMACRDQNSRMGAFTMLVVAIVSLGSSASNGFVFGLIIWAFARNHELFIENRPMTDFFN